jgi:AcrR family transcriptional regulator
MSDTRAADDISRALLDAAHDLLATEGAESLTVRRIATAAGVSTMNVYSRFGGKIGVLDRLFIDGFERLGQAMDGAGVSDDALADLRRCGAAYRRFAGEWPTFYSLMFDRIVPDYHPSDAALDAALATFARLVRSVQRVMDAGIFAPGDAFAVASGLWALEHGLVSLAARTSEQADAARPRERRFDWPVTATATFDALLRGLCVVGG